MGQYHSKNSSPLQATSRFTLENFSNKQLRCNFPRSPLLPSQWLHTWSSPLPQTSSHSLALNAAETKVPTSHATGPAFHSPAASLSRSIFLLSFTIIIWIINWPDHKIGYCIRRALCHLLRGHRLQFLGRDLPEWRELFMQHRHHRHRGWLIQVLQ